MDVVVCILSILSGFDTVDIVVAIEIAVLLVSSGMIK